MGEGKPSLWYKNAVFYGLDVEKFQDSNGDGIGDFPGLSSRAGLFGRPGCDLSLAVAVFPHPQSRQRL